MAYINLGDVRYTGPARTTTAQANAAGLQKAFAVLAKANADLARLLRPAGPLIDKLPYPATPRFKSMLKTKPLDALVEWISPWEDIAKDTITLANRLSNVPVRVIGLPPERVAADMRWEWPDDAAITDYSLRVFIQRLRTVNTWLIYLFYDPGHLSIAFAQTLAKYAQQVARDVGQEAQRLAAEGVRKAQDLAERGASGPAQTAQNVLKAFGLSGYGGLGAGQAAAAVAPAGQAAAGTAGATAPFGAAVLEAIKDIAGLVFTSKVTLAIIGLLTAIVGASAAVLSASAPVTAAAVKSADADKQKNPYIDKETAARVGAPNVAGTDAVALQRAAAAAAPSAPWGAIAGIGAVIVALWAGRKR